MGQNTTTLGRLITHVRLQTGLMSESEPPSNPLTNVEMADMVHFGITTLRSVFGTLLDQHYRTEFDLGNVAIAAGAGESVLPATANVLYDTEKMSLYHATIGPIPVYPKDVFDSLKGLYAYADMAADDAFATVFDSGGTFASVTTPPVRRIAFWSGAANLNNVKAAVLRDPIKITDMAGQLDFPERHVPLLIGIVTLNVYKRIGREAPVDIQNRVMQVLGAILQLRGRQVNVPVEGV